MVNNAELQQVEARLSESNKEMQDYIDLNVELEQFAYIASHDIKSPLRTIKSFAGLLKHKFYKTAEDKHKSYFDFIENGINSLNLLVDDLLEYSKSVTKNQKIESFELNEVIQDVIQLLDFSINQANGKIEVKNAYVSIHADKIKIKQVIQNLLSNALKFVDKDRPPHIIIEAKDDSNYLIVSVKDNGIGVEEQHFDQVFNKFTRLNSKSTYEGTGLGLSICDKYIKEHNGEISITRNHEHGVTLTFSIDKNLEVSN